MFRYTCYFYCIAILCISVYSSGDAYSLEIESISEQISPDSVVNIKLSGGSPPFRWHICGYGFSLAQENENIGENVVITSADACGTATITIVDSGKNKLSAVVKSETGVWKLLYSDQCKYRPILPVQTWVSPYSTYEYKEGEYKQTEKIKMVGFSVPCGISQAAGCGYQPEDTLFNTCATLTGFNDFTPIPNYPTPIACESGAYVQYTGRSCSSSINGYANWYARWSGASYRQYDVSVYKWTCPNQPDCSGIQTAGNLGNSCGN